MDIKHLIFDLDDTLYSSACQMSRQISENMVKMTADFFNVDFEQASHMRRENLPQKREEFESRAVLFYILKQLEEFLLLKKDFISRKQQRK